MRLSWNEIAIRAARFASEWANATYERGEAQSFYNEFFEIFGVRRRTVARYEEHVRRLDDTHGFIYSSGLVYNTFPLPPVPTTRLQRLAPYAEAVLAARANELDSTLADLYDPDLMPADLRKEHQALDRAVDRLYRRSAFTTHRERVEHLFGLYEKMVAPLTAKAKPKRRLRRGGGGDRPYSKQGLNKRPRNTSIIEDWRYKMEYEKRWEKINLIGEGGQGKVFRVLDTHQFRFNLKAMINSIQADWFDRAKIDYEKTIREEIAKIVRAEDPVNHGALKILHSPNEARNFEDAEKRLSRELEAMTEIDHPSLLKVVDQNIEEKWFVSKFYQNGTLENRSDWFTGQVKRTLTAIRPVVDGVATLHNERIVHRDIKPGNVFVDEREQLVLGDFGLVFFMDPERTRLSSTYENVGSTDWMPQWATRMRIEDVRPSFDVFSLGKTIWSMVSPNPILHLWYHNRDQYNLEKNFPDRPEMASLNKLLDKCIVENEENCLEGANQLLEQIDSLLGALRLGAEQVGDFERPCKVCGYGKYELFIDKDHQKTLNFGLDPTPNRAFKIFRCNNCWNVQFFFCQNGSNPPGWEERNKK